MPQKTNVKRPDDFTAPELVGNQNAEAIYQALRPLDKVAFDMEMKWGVGRLQELATPETAAKFGAAKAKLDQAIIDNIPAEVAKRASVMIRGWQALEKEVEGMGRGPMPTDVWSTRSADGEVAYAITKDTPSQHAASDELKGVKVYSLEEVVRIIELFESKSLTGMVKEIFPKSTVDKISKVKNDIKVELNDDIPF